MAEDEGRMEISGDKLAGTLDLDFRFEVEERSGEDLSRCYYCLKCLSLIHI